MFGGIDCCVDEDSANMCLLCVFGCVANGKDKKTLLSVNDVTAARCHRDGQLKR